MRARALRGGRASFLFLFLLGADVGANVPPPGPGPGSSPDSPAPAVPATPAARPASTPEPHPDPEALDAARAWLALLDAGKYGEAWDGAAPFLQQKASRDAWVAGMAASRGTLGDAAERTFRAAFRPTRPDTGAPDPNRLVLSFAARFGAAPGGAPTGQEGARTEVVALERLEGGWRPLAYFRRGGDETSAVRMAALDLKGKPVPDFPYGGRDGKTHHLAEFRGKWLFLETGRTTCLPSENMAVGLSAIRRELEGKPFEYLHVWAEPTWDDVDLGVHFPFAGVEGWVRENPDLYRFAFPTCLLVDPQGTVRAAWVGGVRDDAVRALLAKEADFPLPDGFADVAPARQAQEQAAAASGSPGAPAAWKAAAALAPDDPFDLFGLLGWGRLPDAERAALRDQGLARYGEADRLHWQLLRDRADSLLFTKPDEALALFRTIRDRYPHSQRMRLAVAALTSWGDDDLATARDSAPWEVPWFARFAAGYLFEEKNDLETASRLLDDPDGGWSRIHGVSFLARHGSPDRAREAVGEMEKDAAPATADRNASWAGLERHLAAADWAGAVPWGDRHYALTAWNAMGPAVRLLAAVRTGDAAARDAALAVLAGYKTDRAPYLYAQRVQTGAEPFSAGAAGAFAGDPHATVAFLWLGAWLESQGRPADAAQVYALRLGRLPSWAAEYAVYRTVAAAAPKP